MNFNSNMNISNKEDGAVQHMIKGAYFKIFLNYTQSITIINTLHLNWSALISDFYDVQKTAAGGLQQVIAIECFVNGIILSFI